MDYVHLMPVVNFMKSNVILVFLFLFCNLALAKDSKPTDKNRKPASIKLEGREAKALFMSVYAIYLSGGNVKQEINTTTGETVIFVGDNARGTVRCKQETSTTNYFCEVK